MSNSLELLISYKQSILAPPPRLSHSQSPVLDFGKIIIYTSNLRIIRAPPPRPQSPPARPQAPPHDSTSSPQRPRERRVRRGGGARDGEEMRSYHTEPEVKGHCWVLVPPGVLLLLLLRYVTPGDCSSSCSSSRCVIAALVQAPPPALGVTAASCPCWPIAATAPSASCAAPPASPTAWRSAPAAAPAPASRWSHLPAASCTCIPPPPSQPPGPITQLGPGAEGLLIT